MKRLLYDEALLGIRKPDTEELKPLKVKLPLRHVLLLHRLRLTGNQTVSEIVHEALTEYLEGQRKPAKAPTLEAVV